MNKKQHENFFKKNDLILLIGAAMLVIGAILLTVGKRRWIAPCCILMAIGVVIFIIGTTIRVNEKEMRALLAKKLEGFDLSLDTLAVNERRVLRDAKTEVTESFEYDDTTMLRKTKNDIFSSKYTKTAIFPLTDAFIVRTRTVSLVSDEVKNRRIEMPYDSITELRVVREDKKLTFNKKEFNITTDHLVIRYSNGYKFSTPLHVDVKSKEIADRLLKIMNEQLEKSKTDN
ncbi:MAG: hypothetical protein IJW19_06655 [Clostridia bacterium]|nr:hypothetical protein [Clostridia bacterium]